MMHPDMTKAVAPFQENTASEVQRCGTKSSTDSAILKSRSTATDDQHRKLVALLRLGPQTTYSLRKHGLAQCAARVFYLRAMGYNITTERVKAIDSDGFTHVGVARYTLLSEPEGRNE